MQLASLMAGWCVVVILSQGGGNSLLFFLSYGLDVAHSTSERKSRFGKSTWIAVKLRADQAGQDG